MDSRPAGDPARMVDFSAEANWIGPRLYSSMSIVLLVAGILLVDEAGYGFEQTWVHVGVAGWLVSFAIGVGFYSRQGRKLESAVAVAGVEIKPGL
jgi:hypothetical protein